MARAVVVAAPSSGSGKTLVTLAILRALRARGIRVASAKVGPDYIDPRFHEAATGRPCFNLDPWAMAPGEVAGLVERLGRDADLVVIEGVMGLFDGPQGGGGSTADLAGLLRLPVILVVDCRHQAQSVAALVHGFAHFRASTAIAAVILTRVASARHAAVLRESLALPVLAALRHDDSLVLPSRHLGLVQAEENQDLEGFIACAASAVSHETVLDKILEIAAQPVAESVIRDGLPPLGQHVAVASDRAFAFAYPHVLDGWRRAGAGLSFFSPLENEAPDPSADAIFLPGGYPELHAGRLAANTAFLDGLRRHAGLVYGECGGYMVLGESLADSEGTVHRMAGLLPVATSFARRERHLGYRRLRPLGGLPWPVSLSGHEFHYSTVAAEDPAERLFAAADAAGQTLAPMGHRRGRVMGSYAHVIAPSPANAP